LLNGIEELATRGDLLDRSILLYLPEIPEAKRREEKVVLTDFEAARPKILGALLDGVVSALRRENDIHLDRLPRMADFSVWVTAAEKGLGWKSGRFLEAYKGNREDANALTIEASIVGPEIVKLIDNHGDWTGTATDLLAELTDAAADAVKKKRTWPADATRLSGLLRRVVPALRRQGIEVEFSKSGPRTICVHKVTETASSASRATEDVDGSDALDAESDTSNTMNQPEEDL
jgi:hypothetical protein